MGELSLPFPKEIWDSIMSFNLEKLDIHSLSLTCSHLRDIAQPLVFTFFTLTIGSLRKFRFANGETQPYWRPDQIEKLSELLEFIVSPRIATCVKIFSVDYHDNTTETIAFPDMDLREDELHMPDCWFQDQVIAALPKVTGLRHFFVSYSPIMRYHLQILSHLSLRCIRIAFMNCYFVEPRTTLPLPTSEEPQKQDLSTTGLSSAFRYTALLTVSFTQKNIEFQFLELDDEIESLLSVCRPSEAVQSLSLLSGDVYISYVSHLYHFQNIQSLNMATSDLIINGSNYVQTATFPRLEVLGCPLSFLPNFVLSPVHTLVLQKDTGPHEDFDPASIFPITIPLLSRLSSLMLLELEVDDVFQELLFYCHNLKSLAFHIKKVRRASSYRSLVLLDVTESKAETKECVRCLDTIHWPSSLESVEINPQVPWNQEPDDQHERERMYRDVLNSLDLTQWPPRLGQVTFSALIEPEGVFGVRERKYYPFVLITLDGGIREWRSQSECQMPIYDRLYY